MNNVWRRRDGECVWGCANTHAQERGDMLDRLVLQRKQRRHLSAILIRQRSSYMGSLAEKPKPVHMFIKVFGFHPFFQEKINAIDLGEIAPYTFQENGSKIFSFTEGLHLMHATWVFLHTWNFNYSAVFLLLSPKWKSMSTLRVIFFPLTRFLSNNFQI